MTVPTYIDMVLFVIENGFAICERWKGLRSFVFQIPFFTLFNECNSSTAGAFDPSSGSSMSVVVPQGWGILSLIEDIQRV